MYVYMINIIWTERTFLLGFYLVIYCIYDNVCIIMLEINNLIYFSTHLIL